jgi:hypothetical protein
MNLVNNVYYVINFVALAVRHQPIVLDAIKIFISLQILDYAHKIIVLNIILKKHLIV